MVCRNRIGPMIGISDRNGIGSTGSRGGEFQVSESALSTVANRNPVRPETSTFRTTPTITWLTTYLMLNTASTSETSTPATAAASRPTKALPESEPATAAANAPKSNWPSMAMFTTPERSHSTPESEPKISGTARVTEPASSPYRATFGVLALPTTQVRKAPTKSTAKTATSQPGTRLPARTARMDSTAAASMSSAQIQPVTGADSTRSGSTTVSEGSDSRQGTAVSGVPRAKTASATTASTDRMTGVFQWRTAATARAWSGTVAVTVLTPHLRSPRGNSSCRS